jgi:hypothetical protein
MSKDEDKTTADKWRGAALVQICSIIVACLG